MLTEIKNQVSAVTIELKIKYPKIVVGILLSEPTIAYVVGPVTETQFKLAKLRKNPTKPAKKFLKKYSSV